MRVIVATVTPVPSWPPSPVTAESAAMCSGSLVCRTAVWREYPSVLTLVMLEPVTSIASCWAIRPGRAVWSPWRVGMDMRACRENLCGEVEHAQRMDGSPPTRTPTRTRAGGGVATRVVAVHAGVERERLHEVVEERELDLQQRTVAGVFAAKLLEQATQPRGALSGELRAGGVDQHREPRERHSLRGDPEQRTGALEQPRASRLDLRAAGELAMQQTGKAHDGVHIARSNSGPPVRHAPEQA